jgi:solute carrier family 25 protein 46
VCIISVSLAVVIPFYAASVVETVQSDIASEKPGIFDVFQEGIYRFLSWSAPQTGITICFLKCILHSLF